MVDILEDLEEWIRDNITLENFVNIVIAILIILASYFVARFISKGITRVFEEERFLVKVSKATTDFLKSILFYIIILFGIFAALGQLGVSVSGYLTLLGVTGIAFGLVLAFAFQEALGNIIAGFIILSDKPFTLGDFVEVGDTGIAGRVENIGLRSTWIRQVDNTLAIVANSKMIQAEVINYTTRDPNIMIKIPVGVAYGSDVDLVTEILLNVAKKAQSFTAVREPEVIFKNHGDSSLNFELWVWINRRITLPDRAISEMNYKINKEFKAAGIEIPFPQRTLHIESQSMESIEKILRKNRSSKS